MVFRPATDPYSDCLKLLTVEVEELTEPSMNLGVGAENSLPSGGSLGEWGVSGTGS
ncbi:hypothetical protein FRC14_000376, partial [Serendipita sp. 396]